MQLVRERNAEPIPGYRLIEPLGSGGFGEVWKCYAPGGLFKAIKFVYGDLNGLEADRAQAAEELRAIEHIKAIRHPFLLSIDRVECVEGEVVIVTELADQSLADVLVQYQKADQTGIPRGELLGYLQEAAEVLDLLNLEYDLQHLDIKPRNLFLVRKHVKVADFGLVNSLSAGAGQSGLQLGAVTPLYAAPEVFQGKISRHSDQYSLAIVYQELLSGTLPFEGKNCRQLLLLHAQGQPDLCSLPQADRPIVARALAKDPEERFPSCTDFVRALHQAHGSARAEANRKSVPRDSEKQAARLARRKKKAAKRQRPPSTDTVEMVGNVSTDTKPVRNSSGAPSAPPALAGYTFLEGLGCSMLADVWKVRAPDGQLRLVHFIYGLAGADPRIVEEAIYRLRALHHPALAHCEVVHTDPGRLVLVTELIEQTLRERLQHCQGQRLPGIPHDELLGYLRTVAEAVDYLYQQHSIHHLGLNPRALLLQDGRVKVAEFGLAHLLWVPAGQVVAQRNVRYAAPELFERLLSRTCDQYSLALIYQELLTGVHPFQGQTRFVQGWTRVKGTPDVSPLSAPYREVLARALDNDPLQRWPSCTALVQALEAIHRRGAKQDPAPADAFSAILNRNPAPQLPPDNSDASAAALNDIISSLIHGPGNLISIDNGADNGSAEKPGAILRYRFRAGLPLGAARQKLDAIRQHWYGQPIRDEEECLVFHVSMPSNFWRQWIGRQPGIEVQVQLARVHPLSATPIEVNVQIRTFRCNKKRGVQLLEEMGKPLLDALRAQLLVNAEKRTQERLLWPHALQVCPIGSDGKVGKPVRCRGKDISLTGIGFYLPHELPTANVLIQLPTTLHPPAISVPATLVRAQRCADGSYEVGALFQITTLRKSLPEFALQE